MGDKCTMPIEQLMKDYSELQPHENYPLSPLCDKMIDVHPNPGSASPLGMCDSRGLCDLDAVLSQL